MLARLLGLDEQEIPTDRPLGELGIDSLTAAELSAQVEERAGVVVPLGRFLGDETLEDLIGELASSAAADRAAEVSRP